MPASPRSRADHGAADAGRHDASALRVLRERYLLRDEQGEPCESPEQMYGRVALTVAKGERAHPTGRDPRQLAREFCALMSSGDFLPNSPTLMNAGTPLGQLSACFVLPVEDSIAGIFDALKAMALVHQSGGGTGFSFSRLRPRGDRVHSTRGIASGPLSFLGIFDATTEVIKQGGRRRGANMGVLRCDHPDILEFIAAKAEPGALTNFNLSVGVTDAFMQAVARGGALELRNPRDGAVCGQLPARAVWERIVEQAHDHGDPGLLFLDTIERENPTPSLGALEATNPCGEQPLLPWESCNLGSVNLGQMVDEAGQLDEERLRHTVALAVRFLDDVIEVNRHPLEQTRRITLANRKIGLGVMGLADALLRMGLPYDSTEGLAAAERMAQLVHEQAIRTSEELARERGPFANIHLSRHAAGTPRRNATVTSVAPTGSISIIAGCSSGIEPRYALSFVRRVLEGQQLPELSPAVTRALRRGGVTDPELLATIARRGSVRGLPGVPEALRRLLATAPEIAPEWHVQMQAAFQRHCDNAVSKTINIAHGADRRQVEQALLLAHRSGCKGITVYRDGSKPGQVLTAGLPTREQPPPPATAGAPDCGC